MKNQRFLGVVYNSKVCTMADLDNDYELVAAIVGNEANKELMEKCVKEGTAYKIEGDDNSVAILYLDVINNVQGNGIAIYGSTTFAMLLLMAYIFFEINLDLHKIVLKPHSKEEVNRLRSLLTGSSIRMYNAGIQDTVTFRIPELKKKLEKVTRRLLKWEV